MGSRRVAYPVQIGVCGNICSRFSHFLQHDGHFCSNDSPAKFEVEKVDFDEEICEDKVRKDLQDAKED